MFCSCFVSLSRMVLIKTLYVWPTDSNHVSSPDCPFCDCSNLPKSNKHQELGQVSFICYMLNWGSQIRGKVTSGECNNLCQWRWLCRCCTLKWEGDSPFAVLQHSSPLFSISSQQVRIAGSTWARVTLVNSWPDILLAKLAWNNQDLMSRVWTCCSMISATILISDQMSQRSQFSRVTL